MRLLCAIRGHNPQLLREEWVPPDPAKGRQFPTLLQYTRCAWCLETQATATNPDERFSSLSTPSTAPTLPDLATT